MRILYLGTDPSRYKHKGELTHYPIIRTVPRNCLDEKIRVEMSACTHWLFTSPNAVRHWFTLVTAEAIHKKCVYVAIGSSTAAALAEVGTSSVVAPIATQEGVVALLETCDLTQAYIGWPRSSKARPVLANYLQTRGIAYLPIDLYDTYPQRLEPVPDIQTFDEIVFTSPSTVDAFLEIFGQIPSNKKIVALGPVTENRLYPFHLNGTQKGLSS